MFQPLLGLLGGKAGLLALPPIVYKACAIEGIYTSGIATYSLQGLRY